MQITYLIKFHILQIKHLNSATIYCLSKKKNILPTTPSRSRNCDVTRTPSAQQTHQTCCRIHVQKLFDPQSAQRLHVSRAFQLAAKFLKELK